MIESPLRNSQSIPVTRQDLPEQFCRKRASLPYPAGKSSVMMVCVAPAPLILVEKHLGRTGFVHVHEPDGIFTTAPSLVTALKAACTAVFEQEAAVTVCAAVTVFACAVKHALNPSKSKIRALNTKFTITLFILRSQNLLRFRPRLVPYKNRPMGVGGMKDN